MTMASSQGVEFDTVCIVGIDNDLFLIKNTNNFPESYIEEKKRINRDLLYVALTRAISNLHIIGTCTITSLMSPNQK